MFRDISCVCEYGLTLFIQVPSAIIYFVLLGSILIYWSRTLALGLFLIVCIQIVIIVLVKEPTLRIIKKQTKIEQELVKQVITDYRVIIDVKLLNLQNYKILSIVAWHLRFVNGYLVEKFSRDCIVCIIFNSFTDTLDISFFPLSNSAFHEISFCIKGDEVISFLSA